MNKTLKIIPVSSTESKPEARIKLDNPSQAARLLTLYRLLDKKMLCQTKKAAVNFLSF